MLDLLKKEPARVVALIMALLALGAQFGWHLSDPQQDAIKNVIALVLAFVATAEGTRSQVTPTPSPKPPSLPPAALGLFAFFLVSVSGCATARDAAVATLNASADFAKSAEPALEELDRRDQQAVIDSAVSKEDAIARVAIVRARYRGAWAAYRDYRAAWLASATSLRAYDDAERAKLTKSSADYLAAAAALVKAEGALADAVSVVRGAK